MTYKYSEYEKLWEAKIKFFNKLRNVLEKMTHPLAKKVLALVDTELKTNINFLDIQDEDYLLFYPDDKVTNWIYKTTNETTFFGGIKVLGIGRALNEKFLNHVPIGTKGTIEKVIDPHIVKNILRIEAEVVVFTTDLGKVIVEKRHLIPVSPTSTAQKGKIGRTFKNLLALNGYQVTDKEIEEFVNDFKKTTNDKNSFELIKGDLIVKYYNAKSYSSNSGTLGNSCMRYDYCQSFFDLYTNNSNVSCLILKDMEEVDKIRGRALVWQLDNGRYLMDRIYTSEDYEVGLFIDYAITQNWIYKKKQDSKPNHFIDQGQEIESFFVVNLEEVNFNEYPYLDTLKFLDFVKKTISNQDNGTLPLESTDGFLGVGCDCCGGRGLMDCPECGGDGCDFCDNNGEVDCPECS